MKILFLSDDFPPTSFGGAGISTYELAKGVKERGYEVSVVTTVRSRGEEGEYDLDGLKVFRIHSNYSDKWRAYVSLYNPFALRKLNKIMKMVKPDVVHVNNVHGYLSYHSIKLSKRYAKAVVMTLRDAMTFSFGKLQTEKYLKYFDAHLSWLDQFKQAKKRWNPFRNFIIRKYLGYADKLFSVSEALRLALEKNGIRNVEVMHTGIDITEYSISPIEHQGKTILFAGRLSEAKGSKIVEEVMKMVSKEVLDVNLLSAGTNGKWLDKKEMKIAYASSDIVLVPSLCFDALPRNVLEGMATGKPVIGTCFGGAREAIIDGVTGFIVNPFKTKEVTSRILDILRDHKKAEMFGKNAIERVKKDFNLDDKITRLIAVYEKLA